MSQICAYLSDPYICRNNLIFVILIGKRKLSKVNQQLDVMSMGNAGYLNSKVTT